MLVLDAFEHHTIDPIKNVLKWKNQELVNPGGITSKLQSLDVSIKLRQEYTKLTSDDLAQIVQKQFNNVGFQYSR